MQQGRRETVLNLESVSLFVDVAACGSITQAAADRYLSKSMVKKRIDTLEEFVGAKLLERTSKGVTLTPAGTVFLQYAKRLFALIDEMKAECAGAEQVRNRRSIRVAYYSDYVFPMVQYCCDSYAASHPDDTIVPVFTKFANARSGIRNGLFDVAICPKGDASDSLGIATTSLYMNHMVGLVGWGSPLAKEGVLSRATLAEHEVTTHPLWCPMSELTAWAKAAEPWIDVQLNPGGPSAIQGVCTQGGVYLYPESDADMLPYAAVPLEEPLESWATVSYALSAGEGVSDFVEHAVQFFGALSDHADGHLLATWERRPSL